MNTPDTTRAAHEAFEKWYSVTWDYKDLSHKRADGSYTDRTINWGWITFQAACQAQQRRFDALLANPEVCEAVHTNPDFKETCKQYKYGHGNQVDIAQAALDVIRRMVG